MSGFDTGNDDLNAALDRLAEWCTCPEHQDPVPPIVDVLEAAERDTSEHEDVCVWCKVERER